jgi:CMP/dCMP kinase
MPLPTADRTRLDRLVVAVDGPSGAGKSSVSRAVAAELGLRYLDTGSMYRALTWWLLVRGIDPSDPRAVADLAAIPEVIVGTDPAAPTISVDGRDVVEEIRTDEVTAAVSAVSAVVEVRRRMLELQRAAIGAGGIVVEGRDIGTTVSPDAGVKVFLTASPEVRAARRAAEHSAADLDSDAVPDTRPQLSVTADALAPDVDATRAAMGQRDAFDAARSVSPMRRADDAVEMDATELSLEQVVARVVDLVLHPAGVQR